MLYGERWARILASELSVRSLRISKWIYFAVLAAVSVSTTPPWQEGLNFTRK